MEEFKTYACQDRSIREIMPLQTQKYNSITTLRVVGSDSLCSLDVH